MKERLLYIAENEHFTSNEKELIDEILQQSNGDMRRAVTTLQSVHTLALGGEIVTNDSISEIVGLPPSSIINELWDVLSSAQSNNMFNKSLSSFECMNKAVDEICYSGYSAQALLLTLLPKLLNEEEESASTETKNDARRPLSELSKARIAIRIAEAEKNMIEGADEYLQLMNVCTLILSCFQSG
jgi:replication factor C subunit 2/4